MKRLLFALVIAAFPTSGWASDTTINITIPGSGTPFGASVISGTNYFQHIVVNPLTPSQQWLIDASGRGPISVADGADVALGTRTDTAWNGITSNPTLIALGKATVLAAQSPISNFPAVADTNTGAAGASTIRVVLSSVPTVTAGCTGPTTVLNCLAAINNGIASGVSNTGTPSSTAVTVQGNSTGIPLLTKTPSLTLVALDASSVVTGGTAVTALSPGHATAGGFLLNPSGATTDLCVNQISTASGTATAASLICVPHGQQINLVPSAGAVSVVTSDSSHPFGGYGYQ